MPLITLHLKGVQVTGQVNYGKKWGHQTSEKPVNNKMNKQQAGEGNKSQLSFVGRKWQKNCEWNLSGGESKEKVEWARVKLCCSKYLMVFIRQNVLADHPPTQYRVVYEKLCKLAGYVIPYVIMVR